MVQPILVCSWWVQDKLRAEFVDTGLEGTWIESFYNSDLVIAVSDIDESTAGNIDTTKYVASVSGTYKSGQGTIKGLLLHTRKTAHGIWREGDNEGLFQFDVVEDGLVFCGPFFHNGAYMGTWWGRNAQIGRFEEAVGMGVTAGALSRSTATLCVCCCLSGQHCQLPRGRVVVLCRC